jgi:two-component system CheB/CheR fusion protein
MPRSALATGSVDLALSPEEMPLALLKHIAHPLAEDDAIPDSAEGTAGMEAIYGLLRTQYEIDFTYYRPGTVMRRTQRRLSLNHSLSLGDYVRRLREDPEELNLLCRDLLIGVTQFFRDPEAFERLSDKVLAPLIAGHPENEELRLWCAGCATGEEAYTLAILVREQLDQQGKSMPIKIFATDVHRASLDVAGAGVYEEECLVKLSEQRRKQFFRRQGDGYVVSPDIRQMIVFAPHNIIRDAPFTRLDLVICRNLLIYLQPVAQEKAISLFHFGLRAGGFMFLGPSESPAELQPEFETIDERWKIYQKKRDIRLPADMRLPSLSGGVSRNAPRLPPLANRNETPTRRSSAAPVPFDLILDAFMPPSIVVSPTREVLHMFAGAEDYLRLKGGRVSTDVLDLVDDELRMAISGALPRALKQSEPVVIRGITVSTSSGQTKVTVSVTQLRSERTGQSIVVISFIPFSEAGPNTGTALAATLPSKRGLNHWGHVIQQRVFGPSQNEKNEAEAAARLTELSRNRMQTLETELRFTEENLQTTIEELETSNEELQATNEELVASNEELQSSNEELHSVNEELYTVNAEYQRKIAELTELTNDMENLFRSTEVGTVFLDRELCIRKFTPQIASVFDLAPQDVGRRLDAFHHKILDVDLTQELSRVIEEQTMIEREVTDKRGRWYLLRILPYRVKEQVEGVTLTLVEITKLKETQESLRSIDARLNGILDNSPTMIFVKDREGRYLLANRQCEMKFCAASEIAIGKTDFELLPADVAAIVREHDEEVFRRGETIEFEETVPTPEGVRTLLTIKFPLRGLEGKVESIGGVATDITRLKRSENEQREAVRGRDQFLAMLSHELRNPLAAVLNAAHLLRLATPTEHASDDSIVNAVHVIDRQSRQMATLLDDLLDVSRLTQNKLEIREETFDLRSTVADAIQAITPLIQARHQSIEVDLPAEPLWVHGDQSRLQQVQVNLLGNASKYSPRGKRIWLSQLRTPDGIEVRVRDEGNGISEALIASIFDMFVQVGESLDRRDGGMGVGLTLVRSIVELHGGTIEAFSEGLDRGSEFVVRLPHAAAPTSLPVDTKTEPGKTTARILLVEDNEDSRRTLTELLTFYGHQVQTAGEGAGALERFDEDTFDIALVDIGLPGMNGFEIAKAIRSKPRGRDVHLIALTGYGQPADREATTQAGFDEHIVKPIVPDKLEATIQRAMHAREQ